MAKKVESSMLGHDPLAWMNEEPGPDAVQEAGQQQTSVTDDTGISIVAAADGNEFKLVLQATQNIQNIVRLRDSIIQMLENTLGTIEIDASAVTSIDAATLQLFVALNKEAERLERALVFDFPSEKFVASANLLGVSELMGLDKVASGFF